MQAWYLYDGSGQRVEQYVSGGSGNHTYYLPGGVEEVTPSGSLIKYYSAGGMALGVNTAHDASGIAYLASDGLGSVSEALSPSGTATGAQLYSPYGGVRYTSGTMPTSKGFTGQYADAATGLDYYGARYYDPTLGQFTAADTVTDGANRYGYVAGNPTTFTDPTGHRLWAGGDAGGGGGSGPGTSNNGGGGGGHKHNGGSHNDGGGFWGAVLNVGGQVLDATTGIPSMIKDVQTIFNGSASTGDKLWAAADLLFNVAMDVTMVIGVGEGVRAFYMGGKIAADVAEHVGEEALEHVGEDALEHGAACGLSFAASTLVAVPGGQRAIAALKVGDTVLAYDPKTGKTSTQTVEATYINHDTDLLDVTLRVPGRVSASNASSSSTATASTATTTTAKRSTTTTTPTSKMASKTTHDETIHTTANHPWLTADHGWTLAGVLRAGEPVITAEGSTATVEAVRVIPGSASMWDLTVSNVHDFAVGDGAFVVHNCGGTLTDGTKVDFSRDSKGFQHSVDKHAIPEWLGRDPATGTISAAEKDTWHAAIQQTAETSNKIFPWSSRGRPTTGVLGNFEGKPFLVQFDRGTGDLATAFFPNGDQLHAIQQLLRG